MKFKTLILLFDLIVLSSSSFAQSSTITEATNIIATFSSLIFIGVFIFILLLVSGVIKFPSGGRSTIGIISFLVTIGLAFILPQFVPYPTFMEVPDNFKLQRLPGFMSSVFTMMGLPDEWMYVPAIIYLFILPFAGIYTLVWSFISSLSTTLFTGVPNLNKVNRILALIITFLTIPVGWFVKMVWVLFSFMGAWSVAIFFMTFVVGMFFRGYGVISEQYYKAGIGKMAALTKLAKRRIRELHGKINSLTPGQLKDELVSFYNAFYEIPEVARILQSPTTIRGMDDAAVINAINSIMNALK